MQHDAYIIVDDDFNDPLYASTPPDDLDPDLWVAVCEALNDAIEGDRKPEGHRVVDDRLFAYRVLLRMGLAFVVITDNIKMRPSALDRYLQALSTRYLDEVDTPRNPERHGVSDVVIDVIPSWEDDED